MIFIGQSKITTILYRIADNKPDQYPHFLLYGDAGLGKTSLCEIIVDRVGGKFVPMNAGMIKDVKELVALLVSLEPNSFLFIDEIHRLSIKMEEVLYTAMDKGMLTLLIESEIQEKTIPTTVPINQFTLAGATTQVGMMSKPMLSRFRYKLKMKRYSDGEIISIIKGVKDLDEPVLRLIAKRSRGVPRLAINNISMVTDMCDEPVTIEKVKDILDRCGVYDKGLTSDDLNYLNILKKHQVIGLNTLSNLLGLDEKYIENNVEPYLMELGLVTKTRHGRTLLNVS